MPRVSAMNTFKVYCYVLAVVYKTRKVLIKQRTSQTRIFSSVQREKAGFQLKAIKKSTKKLFLKRIELIKLS